MANNKIVNSTSIEPLDENDCGDNLIALNELNEEQLADRRLYVRVAHMQRVNCNTILTDINAEPFLLQTPIAFTVINLSLGGIGILCEKEIDPGNILVFKLKLDQMEYEIKCEVVYCFLNNDKFRAGLKIVERDKNFIKHLKIFVARISLQNKYGSDKKDINPEAYR